MLTSDMAATKHYAHVVVLTANDIHAPVIGVYGNPADLPGWPASSVEGASVLDVMVELTATERSELESAFRTDGEYVWTFVESDIERSFRAVICSRAGSSVSVILEETDCQKYLQRQEWVFEALSRCHLLAQSEEVAAPLAHDINHFLTTIVALASRVLSQIDANEDAAADLRSIHQAALGAGGLTQQILRLSRPLNTGSDSVVVDRAIYRFSDVLKVIAGASISVDIDLHAHGRSIPISVSRLERVLLNLVANARDSIADRGTIGISTDVIGKNTVVRIADSGHGIPEDIRDEVFDPTFTTKPKGTGLGLTIASKVVADAGGRIEILPGDEGGTIVELWFAAL